MDDYYYNDTDGLSEKDRARLARILMLSRAESGLSQEKVALELGIAKKTVQNWEKGMSTPTLPQAIAWFRVMKVAAMPYFIQFMFPEMEGIKSQHSDDEIRGNLVKMMETLPNEGIRQLMFLFYGNHGSSPRAVMNMMNAYLQTPLKDRYQVDTMIYNNYELAENMQKLTQPNNIKPDTKLMKLAVEKEHDAIVNNEDSYILI